MTKLQKLQKEAVEEMAERLVIEYANLSGRESYNRAEFREKARSILSYAIEKSYQWGVEDGKECLTNHK